MKKIILLALLSIIVTSCGPSAKFLSPEYSRPKKVALLPTINQTVDVEGGIVFRNLLYHELKNKKYSTILENNIVDSLLQEEGITDGGQLSTISNEELFKILKVDGLMFIELIICEYKTTGISETRKIKANFKLLTPSNLIWEDEREVENGKSALETVFSAVFDPVGTLKESTKDLGKQLIMKGIKDWLLDHKLKPEMQEVINTSLKTLP